MLRVLQIHPVEPQGHDDDISAALPVNLLAHLLEVLLVDGSEDMRLVEVDMLPIANEPIKGFEKELVPLVVLGLLEKLLPELRILVVLKHIPRREVLPFTGSGDEDVVGAEEEVVSQLRYLPDCRKQFVDDVGVLVHLKRVGSIDVLHPWILYAWVLPHHIDVANPVPAELQH